MTDPPDDDAGFSYVFVRSDIPALLFLLTPVIGLALSAPLWWYAFSLVFYALLAIAAGYRLTRK